MPRNFFRRGAHADFSETPMEGEPVFTNGSEEEDGRVWVGDGTNPRGVQVGWPFAPTPGHVSGYYYNSSIPVVSFVTANTLANFVLYQPVFFGGGLRASNGLDIQSFHFEVTTAVASTNAGLAVYNDNGGQPGDRLIQSGSISMGTTGVKTWSVSRNFIGGWYWLAFNCDSSAAAARSIDNLGVHGALLGSTASTFAIHTLYFEVSAFASTPFPASATLAGSTNADFPAIRYRVA